MSKYGSDDVVIEVDNSGGTLVNLSQYIDTINEINISAMIQESHAFGDSWVEQLYTGVKMTAPITIEGFYDDTSSTGPDVVLNSLGDTRTFKITYGSTKTTSVEAVITSYVRRPVRGELTRFTCTLTPTGAVTEA